MIEESARLDSVRMRKLICVRRVEVEKLGRNRLGLLENVSWLDLLGSMPQAPLTLHWSIIYGRKTTKHRRPCALARPRSSRCGVGARESGGTSGFGCWSGGARVRRRLHRCKSLYSGCCGSSVPGNLVALVAYPVVVRFHHAHRPCGRPYDHWGFDLTCARSTARPLAPPYRVRQLHALGRPRRRASCPKER
ncbi:hypothetical protein B296_00019765 [Ensete ventricosum]|uniref:Uncharacterized protein n=1 Tax=Ensete ventricosum TaxID=4639 RepID=A0A426XJR8_ENSVE|nr:hypothetical protein B296_00019765 [Ensete ventricosum]